MTLRRKTAKYPSRAQLEERRAWAAQFESCWIWGRVENTWNQYGIMQPPEGMQTHEIASRAQAPLRWATVENYFRACNRCNMHVLNNVPESLQLCYKKHMDPTNYNRVLINRLRGEADNAISEADVNAWNDYVKAVRK